jgi:L-Ala-D/L-Glu epimerase
MRIKQVIAYPVDLPYIEPWVISGGPTGVAANVIVQVISDDGIVGIGEATPVPAYGDETQESVLHAIRDHLAGGLIGRDPWEDEALWLEMDRRLHGHHFAKAALDIALYDLRGKALGLPVYQLLGGKVRDKVECVGGVGLGATEERVRKAVKEVEQGHRVLKMKISGDGDLDVEQVGAIRAAVGPKIHMRLDANQGYRSGSCLPVFKKLEQFGIDWFEQPIPRWDLDGLAYLAAALDTPIMGDESCYTPEDIITLVRHRAVDIVNIKIMKSGLSRSKKIAAIADAAGIPCMVGSMGEFGIGSAAGVHFAIATPAVKYPCEVGSTHLAEDVAEGNPYCVQPPERAWPLPEGPGLGITLRPQYTQPA